MKLNNRGANLVELMIGVSILAVVALAGATLAQVGERANNYPDRKMEFNTLATQIMENLKHEKSCTAALLGNNLDSKPNSNGKGNAYGNAGKGISGTGRKIYVQIPSLRIGPAMNGTAWDPDAAVAQRQILPRRLEIEEISLRNGMLVDGTTDPNRKVYLASVYLEAREIGGMDFKGQIIGSVTLITDSNDNLTSCQSVTSNALKDACAGTNGMGCVWDPNTQPNCRCLVVQEVCSASGYYPTSFEQGPNESSAHPVCTQIGGSTCPAGEFIVGIGIGRTICAPVPTVCPAGSSTTGLGSVIPGLSRCICNNVGEAWNNTSKTCVQSIVNGTCGASNGQVLTTPPPSPCNSGAMAGLVSGAGWTWNCNGANGGTSQACAATKPPAPVNGLCGTSHGTTVAVAPTTNLCTDGTATAVAGSGPWTWDCTGLNGGTTANCSANFASGPPPVRTCDNAVNPAEGWVQVDFGNQSLTNSVWKASVDPWYNSQWNMNLRTYLDDTCGTFQHQTKWIRENGALLANPSQLTCQPSPGVGTYGYGPCRSDTHGEKAIYGFRQGTGGFSTPTSGQDFLHICNCP